MYTVTNECKSTTKNGSSRTDTVLTTCAALTHTDVYETYVTQLLFSACRLVFVSLSVTPH